MLQGTHNAARKVIDGFHYIADSITSVGSKPTKMISDWMNDRIAPEYWVPNSQISVSVIKLQKLMGSLGSGLFYFKMIGIIKMAAFVFRNYWVGTLLFRNDWNHQDSQRLSYLEISSSSGLKFSYLIDFEVIYW